jgi:hypothetical protein
MEIETLLSYDAINGLGETITFDIIYAESGEYLEFIIENESTDESKFFILNKIQIENLKKFLDR